MITKLSGSSMKKAKRRRNISHAFGPLSAMSPLKTYLFRLEGVPCARNIVRTSSSCPWVSPTTMVCPPKGTSTSGNREVYLPYLSVQAFTNLSRHLWTYLFEIGMRDLRAKSFWNNSSAVMSSPSALSFLTAGFTLFALTMAEFQESSICNSSSSSSSSSSSPNRDFGVVIVLNFDGARSSNLPSSSPSISPTLRRMKSCSFSCVSAQFAKYALT
mmetsp:Transcript_2598/g.5850  ORF Transcript_2598/g.5850 Transcript_2598/m.5850 type:complete len:215 (-) Transcript_2598:559-1203(-)